MNNPAINQALIELEENLSNIESARMQVNKVAEKCEQLITAFSNVLETINSADTHITIDEKAIKQYLEVSFSSFKTDLSKIIKDSANSVKGLQSGINDHVSLFENFVNKATEITDEQLKKYTKNLQSNFDEKNAMLSNSTDKILESLLGLRKGISNESITKKLNQDLENFQLCIKELIKKSEDSIKNLESALINSDKSFFTALKTALDKVDTQLKHVTDGLKSELKMTLNFIHAEMNVFITYSKSVNEQMHAFENNLSILNKKILELDFEGRFKEVMQRVDENNDHSISIEHKIEDLDFNNQIAKVSDKLDANSNRIEYLENHILSLEKKIDSLQIENKFAKIEEKISSNQKQMLIMGILIILGIIIAKFI